MATGCLDSSIGEIKDLNHNTTTETCGTKVGETLLRGPVPFLGRHSPNSVHQQQNASSPSTALGRLETMAVEHDAG